MFHDPYFYPSPPLYLYRRPQFPVVDPTTFTHSVTAFQKISTEADIVLKKFGEPGFAVKLMSAAQAGNKQEVDRLMKSIGVSTPITTTYTPTGILLTIHGNAQGAQCCTLTMFLKWGR